MTEDQIQGIQGQGGTRGKKNYKGRARHFTNEEEMKAREEKEQKDRDWRKQRGEVDSDEEEDKDKANAKARGLPPVDSESGSGSEEEDEEEEARKPKGVEDLIEISNPNRAVKQTKKVTELEGAAPIQLSRREREELQKQQAAAHYRKLHQEGKTEEAQADMARLALVRKQREEAAKKRDEERQAKEMRPKKK